MNLALFEPIKTSFAFSVHLSPVAAPRDRDLSQSRALGATTLRGLEAITAVRFAQSPNIKIRIFLQVRASVII